VIEWIHQQLEQRAREHQLRALRSYHHLIDFCSNDYLGLRKNNLLEANIQKLLGEWNQISYGTGGSRLISGQHDYHQHVEEFIASHHGVDSALLFDNGYMANHGLLTALGHRGMQWILDSHCHASLMVSAHQSQANGVFKFRHNDLNDLEHKLQRSAHRNVVVIEHVYSMDGDLAPVDEILSLCERYDAQLIIDEAHAFGWLGPHQTGGVYIDPNSTILARIMTYGKGGGCHGAAILSSQTVRQFLINFCRPFIYSTATTPHLAAAIQSAYDHILAHPEGGHTLMNHITYWQATMGSAAECLTPIQIVRTPKAREVALAMEDAGLGVKAILPPTVAIGDECVRICLHSFQTQEEMDLCMDTLKRTL
jgi:8-amino-7-oxononanoate synthase